MFGFHQSQGNEHANHGTKKKHSHLSHVNQRAKHTVQSLTRVRRAAKPKNGVTRDMYSGSVPVSFCSPMGLKSKRHSFCGQRGSFEATCCTEFLDCFWEDILRGVPASRAALSPPERSLLQVYWMLMKDHGCSVGGCSKFNYAYKKEKKEKEKKKWTAAVAMRCNQCNSPLHRWA